MSVDLLEAAILNDYHTVSPEDLSNLSDLYLAINNDDIPWMKSILDGQEHKYRQSYLMHRAALAGRSEIIKLLLDCGFSADARYCDGSIPLHWACRTYHLKSVQALINHTSNVNVLNKDDVSPFALLAINVNMKQRWRRRFAERLNAQDSNSTEHQEVLQIMELMLSRGADFDASDNNVMRCVQLLLECGNKDYVDLLAKYNFNFQATDVYERTLIHFLAEDGYAETLEALLKHVVLNPRSRSPLHVATQHCNVKVVEMFLENGWDVNAVCPMSSSPHAITPLLKALSSDMEKSIDVLKVLLRWRCDVNVLENIIEDVRQMLQENDDSWYKQRILVIKNHFLKMHAANQPLKTNISKEFINYGSKYDIKFLAHCRRELDDLNNTLLTNSILYSTFLKDASNDIAWSLNADVIEKIESQSYVDQFPIYADVLFLPLRKSVQRRRLIGKVESEFNKVLSAVRIPYTAIIIIINCLSNEDLELWSH